ncbi:U5 small nuclear ribonuclear protein, putative [Plasmodium knowlesi strain H]|uniref:U5 small nuclear ribonuclear protein, putative n=3 Tax=Plasmodium knowlesi TaxID=5850 RepID=A0A5K1V129_PLAKH|nr:U5 small nuclear ribonucleoprotein component, putative [Plasmodium knowlesi strain H]OTN66097.1 putative U5 small nuclear ribonuclear protein [Plasmodium knowlesi]CAA9987669.1 U5 small nuclear ribonucleoprotein component, putative [Plasmodium knowlesi strain H]SBO26884.1 U5 small nuclear ribonuclear protein, putative [Plasmodium knowlesi strain H]SBO29653.1 U5 small nuclear ribonuclear protein, putative [Plasmodium knowlesi strain H]VVS77143.1 U5 small nuclear ribonucleoprotein component, p|eukprot:XP_002258667.1 u5 small nuclear ribonuclear protein, putative [Plasmodium knowlesi strain H]
MESKNNLYDEFGNYIGEDIESDGEYSDEEQEEDMSEGAEQEADSNSDSDVDGGADSDELSDEDSDGGRVKAKERRRKKKKREKETGSDDSEDSRGETEEESDGGGGKRLGDNMDELQRAYEGVEVFVEQEDTQDIEEATINKINTNVERISFIKKLDVEANRKNFDLVETSLPNNTFSFKYMSELMTQTQFIKNICIAGHFHHGKTTLIDRIIEYTREKKDDKSKLIYGNGTSGRNLNSGTVSFFHVNTEMEGVVVRRNNLGKNNSSMVTPFNSKKIDHLINYTDTRLDEQARGLSIKAIPISLILQNKMYENISSNILLNKKKNNLKYKSYLFNIMDTPGHVNFFDEFLCAVNICECCCLVVDVTDGCMYVTENVIKTCIYENVKIVLILNCIDKLIMDLRLPPNDAYHKINYTIEEINKKIESFCDMLNKSGKEKKKFLLSPLKNNVLFASSIYGVFFTLKSFSKIYCNLYSAYNIDIDEFAQHLWGDIYFNEKNFSFVSSPVYSNQRRSFVEFILNPIYKIFGYVCSEEKEFLIPFLKNFNITLKKNDYLFNNKYLLKKINGMIFEDTTAFVDVILDNCPSPLENAKQKTRQIYSGSLKTKLCYDMMRCLKGDQTDNLMVYIIKNYHRPECIILDLFGRVMCGTIRKGQTVRILGEGYSPSDDEDMITRVVTHLWIYEGRYRVEVDEVPAGNFVLIGGVDICINKTCTITNVKKKKIGHAKGLKKESLSGTKVTEILSASELGKSLKKEERTLLLEGEEEETEIFYPLHTKFKYINCANSVFKVACEPINPSELPKMLEGLRKIDKTYPLSCTKVEESGEHIILGTGELYLDCILHDLRKLYGDLEIKVSDPVVQFNETVIETSALNCFAETPNKKNKIHMIVEPLQKELTDDIVQGLVHLNKGERDTNVEEYLRTVDRLLLEEGAKEVQKARPTEQAVEESGESNKSEESDESDEFGEVSLKGGKEGEPSAEQRNQTLNYNLDKNVISLLRDKHNWDMLSIRSIWAFGPENNSPNILVDDSLYKETNKENLYSIKENIIQGFCWATKEGPLIEECMKNVKVKILKGDIDDDPINRGAGQIIPTTRRAIYSSFLLATPRLMEPILFTEIICSGDSVSSVYNVLSRRRGHVLKDFPKVGTPLYMVHAYIPAIESFGFETDLRTHTSGQAFCLSMFDHWHIVPGDPLDKSVILRPLEPAPIQHLAREFLLKTRRRKGLTEDVTINRFFDDPMLLNIKDEFAEYF